MCGRTHIGTWLLVMCLVVVLSTAAFAAPHKINITVTLTPNPVVSGNTVRCTATGVDSQGHSIIAWHWRDVIGGSPAGGSFSPSADVQNPTYSPPANNSDVDVVIQLFAEATCDGPSQPSYGNRSQNANLTIQPVVHTLSVTASADPDRVTSAGLTSLSATATDSRAHGIATWAWDDGGAGGSFSPSADVQNPSYAAPANPADTDLTVTLSVTAICDGASPLSDGDSISLTVNPLAHSFSVTQAAPDPSTVASGGASDLSASAADSRPGHSVAWWAWDDGGAGGSFAPSADVQSPSYAAPENLTDDDLPITLTVLAECDGPSPVNDDDAQILTVAPALHTLVLTATAAPAAVVSGGSSNLMATATDSRAGHSIATWSWSDGGAGGSFTPSANVQNPAYTAPVNLTDDNTSVTLTVTATCDGPEPLSESASCGLIVTPIAHSLSIGASCAPATVASGGTTSLTASATDARPGHSIATWSWSDGGAGGNFSPSADVKNPSYTAPENTGDSDLTVTLTVTATCDGPSPLSDSDSAALTVNPVGHTLSVAAGVAPASVASGGTANLSATATDSRPGHSLSYTWEDGGAGGSFAPSADVQNPSYTAPENTGDSDLTVTLTVTATCNGPSPLSDSDSTSLTVNPVPHTLTASASCDPSTVASGGTTALTGGFTDSRSGHSIATWAWEDGGAGGSFSPSASLQNPSYTAPSNTGDSDLTVTLTVTATCNGPSPLSDSDSTTLTVNPVAHTLSVTASATPGTVSSGGSTSLSASPTDSRTGHSIATWSWSDGGAGGSFSPSANVQNPSYAAPANTSDDPVTVTLTVTATCNGTSPLSDSDSVGLTVNPANHALSVSASAVPPTVASGGTTTLSAEASDSLDHSVASWSWEDGGAGGNFSPSAEVQNPSYTAADNDTGGNRVVTLTVTATCDGPTPISGSASTTVTVQPRHGGHTFVVTAGPPTPGIVASGGSTVLSAGYSDGLDHGVASWSWEDGGAGGTFSPSADVPAPTYTAPENATTSDITVTLTVTVTCDGPSPATDSASTWLIVQPASEGNCEVVASSFPTTLEWDKLGVASITLRNLDDFTWEPGDGYRLRPQGGMDRWGMSSLALAEEVAAGAEADTFSFAVIAPPLSDLAYPRPTLQATPGAPGGLQCAWEFVHGSVPLHGGLVTSDVVVSRFADIQPGTAGGWARFYVEECAGRVPLIVGGYDDGTYRPTVQVDRAAMAVYMSRALKLDLAPYQGSFPDVPSTFWAALYIEALVRANIAGGYDNGTYRPAYLVGRDAMAVYVARGMAGGNQNVPPAPATASFPDVPTSYWAHRYVEYAKANGVVGGYPDGTYRPAEIVTRAQMSVYVYRGFIQPTGNAVVLGGPGVTAVNLATTFGFGWASEAEGPTSDPGCAYLVLDAIRLGPNLAYPHTPNDTCEVVFELRAASDPSTPATGDYRATASLTQAEIEAARSVAAASGVPYFAVYWDLPAGLDPGNYLLVVSVEDDIGVMRQIARKPTFTILP